MRLLLLLALLNSTLYCCLQPLWEGFDEPFHYAYVESISANKQIPVLKQTPISAEVYTSLTLVPVSFILKRNIPGTVSFEDWFAFSRAEQLRRIRQLQTIPPEQRQHPSPLLNYEAQQTPLAYLLLAPIDTLLSGTALPARILALRLLLALTATVLILWGCIRLCHALELHGPFLLVILAVFFETQIFAAAICHVANDWLSITAAVWFFATMASLARHHRTQDALLLSIIVAIGLLSKAYFLAFIPIYVVILMYERWRLRLSTKTAVISLLLSLLLAGPWYIRNLRVYGTLAGLQENVKGASRPDVLEAFQQINWGRALMESARWSLWTGNESHIAFSQGTLNFELLLWAAALVLFVIQIKKIQAAELWTFITVLIFIAALLYDLCIAWGAHEGQTTTGPYYAPCILPAVLALVCLGLQRSGVLGRFLAIAISVLAAWIAGLTYIAKLVPYYGGFIGRSTLSAVWNWWTHGARYATLSATALVPAGIIYVLLLCFLVTLALLTARTVRMLGSDRFAHHALRASIWPTARRASKIDIR